MTVVHRLSGWKLLAWLAANGPPALELDEFPSPADAHTNIVAGYVCDDGRTVVVRLSQAEAELESLPVPLPPPRLFAPVGVGESDEAEFTLVTSDGRRVGAKFVGLDSSTGLSLLEASGPVLSGAVIGAQGDTEDPTVGQRVRLYAPTPVAKPASQAGVGYIYLSIDQKEGRLIEVRRGPSGRLVRVVARANVTPEWMGAVAANELGEVVGIVSHSTVSGETQIVPVVTMLSARERVMRLRGSAPQPWLGVRGDASFQLKLDEWVSMGWKPEFALPRIQNGQGVFLTAVAPGTPAAMAGFRPGDVIASVGARDVRSVEDLSSTLNEAGVGSVVDFTVWRALEPVPLKFSVQLRGKQNPALATAEAEGRAARESLFALRREVSALRVQQRQLGNSPSADKVAVARLSKRLSEVEERLNKILDQINVAELRAWGARDVGITTPAPQPGHPRSASASLLGLGLHSIGLTARGAARLGARGGLLIVAIRPESSAAACGLRAGDVIETINGAPFTRAKLTRLLSIPDAQPVSLGVIREGHRLTHSLPLSALVEP